MKIEDRLALYEKLVLKERRGTLAGFGLAIIISLCCMMFSIFCAVAIGAKYSTMQEVNRNLALSISFGLAGITSAVSGIVWHFYTERTDRKWKDLYTEVTKDAGKD